MQNLEFSQLVDKQTELAQKALLLQDCGIVKSVDVKKITSDGSFEVAVILNHYGADQRGWIASKLNYGDDKSLHANEEDYQSLLDYVNVEIDKLNMRSQTIVARISNILSTFKK